MLMPVVAFTPGSSSAVQLTAQLGIVALFGSASMGRKLSNTSTGEGAVVLGAIVGAILMLTLRIRDMCCRDYLLQLNALGECCSNSYGAAFRRRAPGIPIMPSHSYPGYLVSSVI